MELAYYIIENHLPIYTWPLLILVFFCSLGVCVWRGRQNQVTKKRPVLTSLLITYITAIFFATLIFRVPAMSADGTYIHKAEWIPLWSWYEVIVHHSGGLFEEILLNVVLFAPLGVLIKLLYKSNLGKMFLIGFILSAFIEIMQFITCRGLFEWDDMIHNGLGCLLGYGIGRVILRVQASQRRRKQA